MIRLSAVTMLAGTTFFTSGCGEPKPVGPQKASVSGTVTMDGKPLPDGQIVFVDESGTPPRQYGGAIKEGAYAVEVTPGKKLVQITAMTALGVGSNDPGANLKQIIPARYNDKTTLTTEIPVEGQKDLPFALTSGEEKAAK